MYFCANCHTTEEKDFGCKFSEHPQENHQCDVCGRAKVCAECYSYRARSRPLPREAFRELPRADR